MPENWKTMKLGDLCDITMGQSPKSSFYNSEKEGMPFLQGNRTFGDKYPTFDTWTSFVTKEANAGDVIMSVRAPVGDVNITPFDMCLGRGVCSLRHKEDAQEYLYYLMRYSKESLLNRENGTVFGSVNRTDINNLEVKVPPLQQQVEIGKTLAAIDEKIENNKKINHHLAELLQVNLTKQLEAVATKHRIGDLDLTVSDHVANGSFAALKENVELVEYPDYALFLRNIDLKNDLNGERRYVTKSSYNFLKKSRLTGHEVIISNVADVGSVHRVPKLDIPMVAGNNVVFLQSQNGSLTDYLFVYFNSRLGQHDIASITSGSAQQKFNKTDFRNLEIPVLSNEIIENEITPLLHFLDNSKSEITSLMKTRDALLPKLMSGELSISDYAAK